VACYCLCNACDVCMQDVRLPVQARFVNGALSARFANVRCVKSRVTGFCIYFKNFHCRDEL